MMVGSYTEVVGNIERLVKGTSNNEKYKINAPNGSEYLIRIYDFTDIERAKKVAGLLKMLETEGIPAQKLIGLYASECLRKVYLVLEWCDGMDAYAIIPTLTKAEQYKLGVQSGKILQKIHSLNIPVQNEEEPWINKITNQTRDRIQLYKDSGYRFDGDEAVIDYLEENTTLVNDRPQTLRHGDYHFGNLIVSRKLSLAIIDWNSCGLGDPWEEFQQIAWYVAVSPFFAIGQLHGYFNGNPPVEFFPILAYYMASCAISSIVYAGSKKEQYINFLILRGKDTVMWFNSFRSVYPNWYISQEKIINNFYPTDIEESSRMSIEDEVKALIEKREREKREQAKAAAMAIRKKKEAEAKKQALEKAWNESGFIKADPIAIPCPPNLKKLIDEVFDYLRFSALMIFGKAPDGTMRVRKVKEGERSNCSGFILEHKHEYRGGGKDSELTIDIYEMWILDNKYIFISNNDAFFDPSNLRKWFVRWIADGKPETEWENKWKKKELIKEWKKKGLCTYCGGNRSPWNGRCKKCGR
jgi:serine/threonine-protein kinase